MSHTGATVDEFKKHLTDNAVGIGAAQDSDLLGHLEGATLSVVRWLDRSSYGSGFGPRVASNTYIGDGTSTLDLRDDLQGLASITVYDPPNSDTAAYTLGTADWFLEPYGGPPYRTVRLHGYGQLGVFPRGTRLVAAGTAGYGNETVTTSVTAGTVSDSSTTINVSAGSVVSAGHTLRIASEDIYVTAVSSGTVLTVRRGQNGTTAAAIADGAAVAVYVYDPTFHSAVLAVAQRRHKNRTSGLTGDFGIEQTAGFRDTERSIMRAHVGPLKVYGAG